jgi:hypothetical protein
MNGGFGKVEGLLPKAQRNVFDGHDKIQDNQIGEMHDSLSRVDKHVDRLTNTAAQTTDSLTKIAKAMKAIHDNTVDLHTIHAGPIPSETGRIDAETALPTIGDLADKRPPVSSKQAGVQRIPVNPPAKAAVPQPAAAQRK